MAGADLGSARGTIRVDADLRGVDSMTKGIKNFETQANASLKRVKASLNDFGGALQKAGGILSLTLTAPIVKFGKDMVDAASDLNEARSAVQQVFGDASGDVESFARQAANNLGIAEAAALTATTRFAAFGKAAGLSAQDTAGFSEQMVQAAADLGSFWNVDPTEMLDKLASGLAGETEPLRRFGIFLDEATVKNAALSMGIVQNADDLTMQQKVMVRQALILQQMGAATGDFARTSDGLANSQRRLSAMVQDLSAQLGGILLPYAKQVVGALINLTQAFSGLSPAMQRMIVIGGGIAAAIGPAAVVLGTLAKASVALLSPLGLVAAAVGLFIVAWQQDWGGIQETTFAVVNNVREGLLRMAQFFQAALDNGLTPWAAAFRALIRELGQDLGPDNPITQAVQNLYRLIRKLADAVGQGDFERIGEILGRAGERATAWMQEHVAQAADFGKLLFGAILEGFQRVNWPEVGATLKNLLIGVSQWRNDRWADALQFGAELLNQILRGLTGGGGGGVDWGRVGTAVSQELGVFSTWVAGLLTQAQGFARLLWDKITAGIPGVNWPAVGQTIQNALGTAEEIFQNLLGGALLLGSQLLQAVLNSVASVNWPAVGATVADKLGEFGEWVAGKFDEAKLFGAQILQAVQTTVGQVNWPVVGQTVLASLGTFADWVFPILSAALRFGVTILSNAKTSLEGLPWGDIKATVLEGLGAFVDWVKPILDSAKLFAAGVLGSILQGAGQVDWGSVGTTIQGAIQTALSGLAQLGQWVLDRLNEVDWSTVGSALGTAVVVVPSSLVAAFINGIIALKDLGLWVIDRIRAVDWGAVKDVFVANAAELIGGFVGGIQGAFESLVRPVLSGLPARIQGASGDVQAWLQALSDKGMALINGVIEGITLRWTALSDEVKKLPQKAKDAAGSALGVLFGWGADLIQGIINGIESKAKDLDNAIRTHLPGGGGQADADIMTQSSTFWRNLGRDQAAEAGAAFTGVGESAVTGAAEGMEHLTPLFEDQTAETIDAAEIAARKQAESQSPSKLFARIGEDLVSGLIEGMQSKLSALQSVAQGIVDLLSKTASAAAAPQPGLGGVASFGPLAESMDEMGSQADQLGNKLSPVKDALVNIAGAGGEVKDKAVGAMGDLIDTLNQPITPSQPLEPITSALEDIDYTGIQGDAQENADKLVEIENQYAHDVKRAHIELDQALRKIAHDRVAAAKDFARQRAEVEKNLAEQLKGFDEQVADANRQLQEQLADLARSRSSAEADANAAVADAQKQYQQTLADSAAQEKELRTAAAESAAEAQKVWREANKESLASIKEIKEELKRTLAESAESWSKFMRDFSTDAARNAEDFATKMADINTDERRLREDFARDMNDPTLSAEQRSQKELDFQRALEDLATRRADAERERQRELQDNETRLADAQAANQAKVAEARRNAREQIKGEQETRGKAEDDYHRKVKGIFADLALAIQNLRSQEAGAASDLSERVKGIRGEEAGKLRDLADQETSARRDNAEKIKGIEGEKTAAITAAEKERSRILKEEQHQQTLNERAERRAAADETRTLREAERGKKESQDQLDINAATTQGTKVGQATVQGTATGMTQAKPAVAKAGADVKTAATAPMADTAGARTAGNNLVNAFVGGMLEKLAYVRSNAARVGQAANEGIADATQIASPSRVWVRYGQNLSEALAKGMVGAIPEVRAASQQVADAAGLDLTGSASISAQAGGAASLAAAAWQQSAIMGEAGAAFPESLAATVVIQDAQMRSYVVGTAIAPLMQAIDRTMGV